MSAFIEKENIKLGGATPNLNEEKPVWRQEQQRTFGNALGVNEHLATSMERHISSEWYPFFQVYVHESEASQPIPLLSATSGAPVVNCSRGRNVGSHGRQAGYGLQARDLLTWPRSSQD